MLLQISLNSLKSLHKEKICRLVKTFKLINNKLNERRVLGMWCREKYLKDSFIDTEVFDNKIVQIVVIKKENIFETSNKLFGDYDIELGVFNSFGKIVEEKKIKGLNASVKQMENTLNKLKSECEKKYK